MNKQLIDSHQAFLNGTPEIYFSPGRVNLIGEHIDYHGGHVFPAAIELGITAYVTIRQDQAFHVKSLQFEHTTTVIEYENLNYLKKRGWANFVSGMIQACMTKKPAFGLNILFDSTLPRGSGLSSSAALEMLVGVILNDIYRLNIDRIKLIQIAKNVENNYINVNCGIMDQFAVGMGRKDHAIYLNTDTLDYELVPFKLTEYNLIIANTNKTRNLAYSKYNERVHECEQALSKIKVHYPKITLLSQLDSALLPELKDIINNDSLYRRVRHVITETKRTNEAVDLLKQENIIEFSKHLDASHLSLKNDYEVSCFELDRLVELFKQKGAIGARMTGAGFGGSIVAIVPNTFNTESIEQIKTAYYQDTELETDIYQVNPSDGTKKIKKEAM